MPPLSLATRSETYFTIAMLRAAKSETIGQSMGSRTVRRIPTLAWEFLIELYGSEEHLNRACESVDSSSLPPDELELLHLAQKYAGGYRPSDFE
jgi:hypothetical protein